MTETPPPPPTDSEESPDGVWPEGERDENDLLFPSRMPHMGAYTRVVSPKKSQGASTGSAPSKPRSGGTGGIKASNILIFALWGAAAIGVVTFAARKELVRVVAQNWLASQRVPSELKIDRLSFSRISGSAKLGGLTSGPKSAPDVAVQSFDVEYSLNLFAGKGRPLARLKNVRLTGLDARVAYKGGKLNFGALDPMVQKALKAPPGHPDDAIGALSIEALDLKLDSDYGLIRAKGGVKLTKGQIETLKLEVPSGTFHGSAGEGQINSARLNITTVKTARGPQRHAEGTIDAPRLEMRSGDGFSLESLKATLKADFAPGTELLPSGPLKALLQFSAGTAKTGELLVRDVSGDAGFDGQFKQSKAQTTFNGTAGVKARLDRLRSGEIDGRGLKFEGHDLTLSGSLRPSNPLSVSVEGPVVLEAASYHQGVDPASGFGVSQTRIDLAPLALKLDGAGIGAKLKGKVRSGSLAAGDLTLKGAQIALDGEVHADSPQVMDDGLGKPRTAWSADFRMDVASTDGSYTGLKSAAASAKHQREGLEVQAGETPEAPPEDVPIDAVVALDQAARRFSLNLKGLNVEAAGSGPFDGRPDRLKISLASKATAKSATGGLVEISPVGTLPLLATGANGALDLAVSGGDLPQVKASLRQVMMVPQSGDLSAHYDLEATFTQAPLYGANIKARGKLMSSTAGARVSLDACAEVAAQGATLGTRIGALKGVICQGAEPLLTFGSSGWLARGSFRDVDAELPESEAVATGARGTFSARSIGSGLGYQAKLDGVTLSDALTSKRFNALSFEGSITQDAKALTGAFTARVADERAYARNPKPVALIDISGDPVAGTGHIGVRANQIDFTPDGLKPLDLTPTVSGVATGAVTGSVTFDGFIDYGPETSVSGGVMEMKAIDFEGPLGTGRGLNSRVEFTSLTPLLSKPAQGVTLDAFDTFLPWTDLKTAIEFKGDSVSLARSEGLSPGGRVELEPMDVPLDARGEIRGALLFDGLDFGAVLKKTDFAKDVNFTGKLSGKIPFWIGPVDGVQRVRFTNGQLRNDGPGRLSLNPAVLTSVQGGGADVSKEEGGKIEGGSLQDPTGFYRQALSNIAFDEIVVDVNSQDGIMVPKFHVRGRFDPPQKQDARIGFFDLITGAWQSKVVDLPSGTGVDLTVETPINLDQIIDDLMRQGMAEKTAADNRAAEPVN